MFFFQLNKYLEPLLKKSLPVGVYHREVGLEITKWDPDDSLESEETTSDTNSEESIVNHVEYLTRNDVQNKGICVLVKDKGTGDKLKCSTS